MDLTKLSDKELIELKKRIMAEQEDRKDNLSYKNNISFKGEELRAIDDHLNMIFNEKGYPEVDVSQMLHSPVWKISDSMFVICDYIYGNFEYKERKYQGRNDYTMSTTRNTSRLLIDNKADYIEMYHDLYSVIKKHMDKRKEAK